MRNMAIIAAAALAVGGCSAGADRAAAEAGVAQFHQMIEAGRYHDIYVNAADEFRRSTTEAEGIRFLQMVHDRLGAVRSTSSSGWRVNFTPGGSTVSLSYSTQFTSGPGTEDFVFRIGGANAQLVGYHVNSPALIGSGAPAAAATDKPMRSPRRPRPSRWCRPSLPSQRSPSPRAGSRVQDSWRADFQVHPALGMLAAHLCGGAIAFHRPRAQLDPEQLTLDGTTFALSPDELDRLTALGGVVHTSDRGAQDRALAAARSIANSADARYVLAIYQLEIGRQRQDDALRAPALDVLIADRVTPRDRLASYLGVRAISPSGRRRLCDRVVVVGPSRGLAAERPPGAEQPRAGARGAAR